MVPPAQPPDPKVGTDHRHERDVRDFLMADMEAMRGTLGVRYRAAMRGVRRGNFRWGMAAYARVYGIVVEWRGDHAQGWGGDRLTSSGLDTESLSDYRRIGALLDRPDRYHSGAIESGDANPKSSLLGDRREWRGERRDTAEPAAPARDLKRRWRPAAAEAFGLRTVGLLAGLPMRRVNTTADAFVSERQRQPLMGEGAA